MKAFTCFIFMILLTACSNNGEIEDLRPAVNEIISSNDATFGIGIYNFASQDTLFINGDKSFVLMSVVKFPQAIALLDQVDKGKIDYNQKLYFDVNDLRPNTYSPYRDERKEDDFKLSISDALSYTVSKSDNNVCDKLFKTLGGPRVAEDYLQGLGLNSITIGTDYANMDKNTIYANQCSPKDMVELFKRFKNNELLSKKSTEILWRKLVETSTGLNRIKGLLPEGTTVGHKTGTSGNDEEGRTTAYNDVGIVELPNGESYIIVIFISDSKENNSANANAIAKISRAAYDYFDK